MTPAREALPTARAIRFPFVIPRIPPLDRVEPYFLVSRAAGHFSNFGPNNTALERDVAARYAPGLAATACASCTAGLTASLVALGVDGPVLVPGFTFPATAGAARAAGAAVVLGDVDPATGILAAAAVHAAARDGGIRAVLAVRPYGVWTDLTPLAAACRAHGLPLVIDNASGFGVDADVVARHAVPGAVEVFSLHATKPAAIGEGGLILHPPALHAPLRAALNFGMAPGTAAADATGLNGKMDELRAATARAMLDDLPARVLQRQAMAATYAAHAGQGPATPLIPPGAERDSPWHCYPLLLPPGTDPAATVAACARAGLHVRRYYHPSLAGPAPLPHAEALAARVLCLPVYDGPEAAAAGTIWSILRDALA